MIKLNEKWKVENERYKCPYCGKIYKKKGICSHIWRMHTDEGKKFDPNIGYTKKRVAWNKGLTKETNNIVAQYAKTIKDKIESGEIKKNRCKHTDEFKKLMREYAIKRKLGGITQSRWIKYNGKTLGSTYELKIAKSLDENNIKWDTCKRFNYIDPFGKKRTYTPDIYLTEYDIYLDPKNDFLINNINPGLGFKDITKIKLAEKQNNIKVLILNKEQLNWEYVKKKICFYNLND